MSSITLDAAGRKDRGRVRETNEDDFFAKLVQSSDEQPIGLFIVADGVGGYAGGELASKWAVDTIEEELRSLFTPSDPRGTVKLNAAEIEAQIRAQPAPTQLLGETGIEHMIQRAVQRANEVVLGIARAKPEQAENTGSTVTLAIVQGALAYIANVGDSRTYLLRGGELKRITEDHSLVARLVATGQIQPEEIYSHPQRNLIFRSLGAKPDVEVDLFQQELQPGDQLLLCSDGLWEMVRDVQITKILQNAPSPKVACERLVRAANDNGGEDNIAVLVVQVSG